MQLFDIQTLGLVAAAMTTSAFVPQVIKTWKSRSTKDLSLGMYSVLWVGIILWLIYGFIQGDLPIIMANAITFISTSILLLLKLKYGNR